ncbi:enoyl-CoA hydratase/isomerase family protein [Halorubrum amylolyticum]|uniref:enoyl-CoA hydratase/isomerase family protein n=1 Tax=Halorubrum amylolyticum TaxID=2508724 RepID=UPI0010090597|nr:enoyl-CoA hydratase/isomerase family protein [Halorubrum amylolyticum]
MNSSTIKADKRGRTGRIVLDRPEVLNALSPDMNREIREAVKKFSQDDDIHVLVITGSGNAFCSGADLEWLGNQANSVTEVKDIMSSFHRTITEIHECPMPVIAAVNGAAVGGGFSLALLADIILASDTAFFEHSFVRIGLIPDLASMYFLPRKIGSQKARELFLRAERIDAATAKEIGLVAEVTESEEFPDLVQQWATELTELSPGALNRTKALLNRSLTTDLQTFLQLEANEQAQRIQSEDHQTRVSSFLEGEN